MTGNQETPATEEQVQAVVEKFKAWARSLPEDEQAILATVLSQGGEGSENDDVAGFAQTHTFPQYGPGASSAARPSRGGPAFDRPQVLPSWWWR